jgi:CheY-like chemotaxis protein
MTQKKVLIIDDDPAILTSVKAILEGNGYRT